MAYRHAKTIISAKAQQKKSVRQKFKGNPEKIAKEIDKINRSKEKQLATSEAYWTWQKTLKKAKKAKREVTKEKYEKLAEESYDVFTFVRDNPEVSERIYEGKKEAKRIKDAYKSETEYNRRRTPGQILRELGDSGVSLRDFPNMEKRTDVKTESIKESLMALTREKYERIEELKKLGGKEADAAIERLMKTTDYSEGMTREEMARALSKMYAKLSMKMSSAEGILDVSVRIMETMKKNYGIPDYFTVSKDIGLIMKAIKDIADENGYNDYTEIMTDLEEGTIHDKSGGSIKMNYNSPKFRKLLYEKILYYEKEEAVLEKSAAARNRGLGGDSTENSTENSNRKRSVIIVGGKHKLV